LDIGIEEELIWRGCKIIYLPAGYNVSGVSHVNVIFARIVTTAADRRAFASEFISKVAREKCISARMSRGQYCFKFLFRNEAFLYGLPKLIMRKHFENL